MAGAAALVLALFVAAVGYGWVDQRRYNAARFRVADPAVTWVNAHAPSGHSVGLAGTWSPKQPPVLAMFGPRYGNRVVYVGPWVKGMLREYRRPADFRRALRRGRFDLLLVGHGFPSRPAPREEQWARSAGYVPVTRSEGFTLLRATHAPGVTR